MKEYDPDGNPYKHNEEQAEAAKERKDPLETAASPQATPTIARRDQVVLLPSGRKYVVNKDHELPEGASIAANRPHEDGDYSYCCGSDWCRCVS